MHAPIFSTITLITEVLVTISILYIFYNAYRYNRFSYVLVILTLGYEILFNISYMISRMITHKELSSKPNPDVALAAFHGIISLIMFIALIVFLMLAWKKYKKGINFFRNHKIITVIFLFFWMVAVISGFSFYIVEYLRIG